MFLRYKGAQRSTNLKAAQRSETIDRKQTFQGSSFLEPSAPLNAAPPVTGVLEFPRETRGLRPQDSRQVGLRQPKSAFGPHFLAKSRLVLWEPAPPPDPGGETDPSLKPSESARRQAKRRLEAPREQEAPSQETPKAAKPGQRRKQAQTRPGQPCFLVPKRLPFWRPQASKSQPKSEKRSLESRALVPAWCAM